MYSSPRTKKKRLSLNNSGTKAKSDVDLSPLPFESKDYIPFNSNTDSFLCIFCKKPTAPLIKIPSGIFINITGFVHEICLKNKGCCECGVLGLCYKCTVKDCSRLIHSWCAEALHGSSDFCDLHSNTQRKKESSRLPFVKSICRRVISSQFWEKEYKEKDSPSSLCNGHIFWYIHGLEYFPPGYDLSIFPVFPMSNQFELQYESTRDSESFVDQTLAKVASELENTQKSNSLIIKKLMSRLGQVKGKSEENDRETNTDNFEAVNEDYLNLLENNAKPPEELKNAFEIKKADSFGSEILCEVCNEDDYEESLISCDKCSLTVHAKCYRAINTNGWVCDMCNFFPPRTKLPCALCPKKGGALKQTLHLIKDSYFPNYSPIKIKGKKEGKHFIWVHAFCALHTPGVIFKNLGVDLAGIDNTRLNIQCEICKSKDGACLQCNFNRCSSAFHPECGKELFVSTKSNEKKIYCALHKPLKLRKMLEARQKKISEDIYKFCKAMEKYLNKAKLPIRIAKRKRTSKSRSSTGRIFTQDEDLALEYRIQQFLYKLNLSQQKPFTISINLQASTRCSRVSVSRPQFYTLVVPSVIIEESIVIEGRGPEECFKRYQDTLFSKLKNEILLLGNRLCLYQGREISTTKHYTRHKKKPEYSLRVSSDTYCICNQPYYYEIPWNAEWSQEQWEEKVRDNEMVECTKCEKWYHLKCVKSEESLEKAQQDENWKCGICDKKKGEKVKYLDQKSIISDINQGVVTRRGTKIH